MAFHGEYKVPGGKLVVADFAVVAGRLADVCITGDFFLFPDEAIHTLANALNGPSSDAAPAELAARIRAALGNDVEMLGFTPEDVATAIGRGLA